MKNLVIPNMTTGIKRQTTVAMVIPTSNCPFNVKYELNNKITGEEKKAYREKAIYDSRRCQGNAGWYRYITATENCTYIVHYITDVQYDSEDSTQVELYQKLYDDIENIQFEIEE